MPLDSQALLASQAAMHFVPPRDSPNYAMAAVRLQDCGHDAVSDTPGVAKGEREVDEAERPRIRPMRIRASFICFPVFANLTNT